MLPDLEIPLIGLMEEEHIYSQCGIGVDEVARRLGTNRSYLSAFINQRYGKTFSEYINDYRIDAAITLLRADKDMLSRVFGNLLGNILKYAKNGFELYLEEDCEKGVCRIRWGNAVEKGTVIDTEHIFDRTYRADKARSAGSAGLGLYIARLLTERQKGTIEAFLENEKIVFEITFLLFDHEIAE